MKRCLVVDDATFDRAIHVRCAENLGFIVDEACSGEDAIAYCHKKLPDCILLDWEMPGMGGMQFLKELRTMKNGGEVFVLVCSMHSEPSYIGHACVQGTNDYIVKPITEHVLQEKLQEWGVNPAT